ncbi:hypothetical protein BC830DRAFT_1155853 [Chytriomyces sp. MP71]|nr:hypothetical protein BC830DRAFT_1155853 [Chytriomyces sp. MP71]
MRAIALFSIASTTAMAQYSDPLRPNFYMSRDACMESLRSVNKNELQATCDPPCAATEVCNTRVDFTCRIVGYCVDAADVGLSRFARSVIPHDERFGLCKANCDLDQPAECGSGTYANPCLGAPCRVQGPTDKESCWCYICG